MRGRWTPRRSCGKDPRANARALALRNREVAAFREAIRLTPDLRDGRANLARAVIAGKTADPKRSFHRRERPPISRRCKEVTSRSGQGGSFIRIARSGPDPGSSKAIDFSAYTMEDLRGRRVLGAESLNTRLSKVVAQLSRRFEEHASQLLTPH